MEVVFAFRDPVEWHEVRMSNSLLQFGNSIQTNLWKLSAFYPLKPWNGKANFNNDKFHLSSNLDQSCTFMAYVPLPFLLLKGPVQWHSISYIITCI